MTSFQWLSSSWAIEAVSNHLWQSTAFAGLVGLATLAFRKNAASARHALWLVASVKFLVPCAALVAAGQLVGARASAPVMRHELTVVVDTVSQPFTHLDIRPAARTRPSTREGVVRMVAFMALTIWIAGSLTVLAAWWVRWQRVAAIVRRAAAIDGGRELEMLRTIERQDGVKTPIALVASDALLEPGIFGIVRPVLVWPQTIAGQLGHDEIVAIFTHEVSHVRRRDNLTSAIHMIVEALFWFHPLVWWIGARLMDERERACDEAVLRSGQEPEVYAETILKSCRAYIESPLPCIAGVTGSDLKKRIERIMKHDVTRRLTVWKKAALITLAVAPVGAPTLLGATTVPRLRSDRTMTSAARSAQTAAAPAQFEVASVKPNTSPIAKVGIQTQPGGRFTATNVTLRQLIRYAYDLQEFQIAGGPGWLASDRFDIVAKAESADRGDPFQAVKGGGPSRGQLMLRALLAERFKLDVHSEAKELPIYALMLARSDGAVGQQLRRSSRDCDAPDADGRERGFDASSAGGLPACGMRVFPGTILAGGTTLAQLAHGLSTLVGRVVHDRTGLADAFDLTLRWTPDQIPQGFDRKASAIGLPPIDADGPSIFTAVREQLGLRLESQKGPVDVLVIDRAERPIAN